MLGLIDPVADKLRSLPSFFLVFFNSYKFKFSEGIAWKYNEFWVDCFQKRTSLLNFEHA